jgi:hypothetical protein
MMYKYFQFYGLSFFSLIMHSETQKVLNFMKPNLTFLLLVFLGSDLRKCFLSRHKRITSISSCVFYSLALTFRSLNLNELSFAYDLQFGSNFYFWMWLSSCPSITFEETVFFPFWKTFALNFIPLIDKCIFILFFCAALGFELRVSVLLVRHSTAWGTPPALVYLFLCKFYTILITVAF